MSDEHSTFTGSGSVTDLFGHRFVVATAKGKFLADLGPKGAETVRLAVGDEVTVTGERKPSEIKVSSITVGGREHELHAEPRPKHDSASAEIALAAVRAIGFEPTGPARRKPKHFEIAARRDKDVLDFHVEFDGSIRKVKPAKPPKQGGEP